MKNIFQQKYNFYIFTELRYFNRLIEQNFIVQKRNKKGAVAKLFRVLQHNEARQQLMRRNAAKPGQGRERMRGQFAGYIPANRAEKFREAERS